ncbi:MAG: hypothetical protein C4334_05630 [Pyrinomonas sp.]|uniref:polysaccharide biosynthesis/export family protein n=1 Tax=Pyrinomonas sp. TaxID=2080306 RepID=UPI00332F77A0
MNSGAFPIAAIIVIFSASALGALQTGNGATANQSAAQEERVFVRGKWLSRSEYLREQERRRRPEETGIAPLAGAGDETRAGSGGANASFVKEGANAASSTPKEARPVEDLTALTKIYRVGVGDVLDVRVLNAPPRNSESTLYTVLDGGYLDFPLAGPPMIVAGLTTEEIAAKIAGELRKRAVYEQPLVTVTVRAHMSHTVIVTGLVNEPGAKVLRREAVPLYVVLAEAQPRAEAGLATIISNRTGKTTIIDLADPAATTMLVFPGDVVNVAPRPPAFLYVGGDVNMPGQIDFHPGMRLTQAILAAGGARSSSAIWVKVSRQKEDGRLTWTQYNLLAIMDGVEPDPELRPGDRIEVGRRRW